MLFQTSMSFYICGTQKDTFEERHWNEWDVEFLSFKNYKNHNENITEV